MQLVHHLAFHGLYCHTVYYIKGQAIGAIKEANDSGY